MQPDVPLTPEELKALRLSARMTQQAFGEAIGVSRVTVGLMERGEAPIEKRTVSAVRYATVKFKVVAGDTPGVWIVRGAKLSREGRTTVGSVMLYGWFRRYEHAYRWAAALAMAKRPRCHRLSGRIRPDGTPFRS